MNELHLFAGAGGGILGGMLLGHTCVCAVEIEPYCQKVLLQRQRDGILPKFPIWDDVRTFDGKPWKGTVDVVCGGFPCQDISQANPNGDGLDGERSGLWKEMRRIISEVRPIFAFMENSPRLIVRGLDRIITELAEMGYDSTWGLFSAADIGARHKRERIWIVAYSDAERKRRIAWEGQTQGDASDTEVSRQSGFMGSRQIKSWGDNSRWHKWWETEPDLDRVVNGVADRVERIDAIGNGQVPAVVKLAWETLICP